MSNLSKAEALLKISKASIEIKIEYFEWTITFTVDEKTDTVVVSPKLKRQTKSLLEGAEVNISVVHNGIILKTKKSTQVIEASKIPADDDLYASTYGFANKLEDLITEMRFVTKSISSLTEDEQELIYNKSKQTLFELNTIYAAVKNGKKENQK